MNQNPPLPSADSSQDSNRNPMNVASSGPTEKLQNQFNQLMSLMNHQMTEFKQFQIKTEQQLHALSQGDQPQAVNSKFGNSSPSSLREGELRKQTSL
jgi:hypothetical protein